MTIAMVAKDEQQELNINNAPKPKSISIEDLERIAGAKPPDDPNRIITRVNNREGNLD